MGFLTVTLGANQHVCGLGLTIVLIGLAEFGNRLLLTGSDVQRITPMERWDPLAGLGPVGEVAQQYGLTYVAFLVVAPLAWWLLARTPLGLSIRAVGENPEAADAAGISVARVRYIAIMIGSALMAVGGAFLTLAVLGSFTLDIIAGRGWVCIALVIFGRWRIWRGVAGRAHLLARSTRSGCGSRSCPASSGSRRSSCSRCRISRSSRRSRSRAATCPTPAPT